MMAAATSIIIASNVIVHVLATAPRGSTTQPMSQILPLRPTVAKPSVGPALRDAETFRKLVKWSLDMRSAVQSREPDKAIEIFAQCRLEKLRPSLSMYTELMRAYVLRGQTSRCIAILDQMEEDGVVPDGRAVTVAISVRRSLALLMRDRY